MFTAVATKPVPAESSRAAADNRLENATLITGNRGVVLSRKFVSMLPNNVGQFTTHSRVPTATRPDKSPSLGRTMAYAGTVIEPRLDFFRVAGEIARLYEIQGFFIGDDAGVYVVTTDLLSFHGCPIQHDRS